MNIYSIKDHNRELILHISGDDSHPTAPTQVGHDHYTYDANGNPILVENDSLNTERIVKSHGDLEGIYIKGLTSSTIQDQSYYLTEGVLKTPSYIPYLGTLWGLGFDHAVRPTWENGAKNIDNAIKHGADPSIIFIIPGLGYVPSTK